MKKLKCIAIDDEQAALDIVKHFCDKLGYVDLVVSFRDSIKALEYLQDHPVDLLFLDINMPDLNGLEFLKALDQKPMVIFTTAYAEYAVESYEYEAVDYLLKPFSFARFTRAVNRAAAKLTPVKEKQAVAKKTYILVKSGSEQIKVELRDILFFEGAQNYIYIHCSNGKRIMTLMRMKEIEQELEGHDFIRIHKSYIISFYHINKIESFQVTIGDHQIPIGSTFREIFRKEVERRK
jgi:DNA-binding LytR/AlgR family response regulator